MNVPQNQELPILPPKMVFGNSAPDNIKKRMVGLQAFLNEIASNKDFLEMDCVKDFLELSKVC